MKVIKTPRKQVVSGVRGCCDWLDELSVTVLSMGHTAELQLCLQMWISVGTRSLFWSELSAGSSFCCINKKINIISSSSDRVIAERKLMVLVPVCDVSH